MCGVTSKILKLITMNTLHDLKLNWHVSGTFMHGTSRNLYIYYYVCT